MSSLATQYGDAICPLHFHPGEANVVSLAPSILRIITQSPLLLHPETLLELSLLASS